MIFFIFLAYLLGSIPFAFIISRAVKGIDIRQHGSGNSGATNVFRVVGKKWGILVFLLDACKGYLAVTLPILFIGPRVSPSLFVLFGILAILGHTFSFWLKFKGGKGVATSLGVFLGLCFQPTLFAFAVWNAVFFSTRILSLASLSAALSLPLFLILTYRADPLFPYLLPVSILLAGFIFYTHRQNIQRLRKGEEKKLF